MVDVLAPGDLSWALCSTNTAIYTDCYSFNGTPSPVEIFGGTSEAAPVTAGEAALVIQAYRSTHAGQSPSPALVKSLVMSTAADLGAPATEQGAGRIDALAAVHAALSVQTQDGAPRSHGGTDIVVTPDAAVLTAHPGDTLQSTFQITNPGTTTLHLQPALERLGAPFAGQTIPLTYDASTSNQYLTQTFSVPAGADHLDVAIAFSPYAYSYVGLLDPQGRLAAYSFPQGGGSGYGSVDVVKPAAGTWTAIVYSGYGTVQLTWAAENYVAFGSVSPAKVDLRPGASTSSVGEGSRCPTSRGGILSAAVRFPGSALSDIPVGVRILVPVGPNGGSFAGTLTGGNGRGGAVPTQIYAFDVPGGRSDLALTLTVPDPAYSLTGFLVDPNGAVLDSASNTFNLGAGEAALELLRVTPQPGRWKLLLQENQASGNQTSIQFSANIAFDVAEVSAPHRCTDSPRSAVSASQGSTVAVSVTNTGAVTKAYFRRRSPVVPGRDDASDAGAVQPDATRLRALRPGCLARASWPSMSRRKLACPSRWTSHRSRAASSYTEDPDVWAIPVGNGALAAFVVLPEVPYGQWLVSPALIGAFGAAGAPTEQVTTTTTALLQPFDASITSSAGDYFADMANATTTFQPLVLAPGATGTITLTIKPDAASVGNTVRGSLYIDAANPGDYWAAGDEIAVLPYAYTTAP